MPAEKFSVEQIKASLTAARGFISQAAVNLGCEQVTIRNYIKRHPELNDVLKEQRESLLDFAESKLIQLIKEGDKTAIIFFLKTQGRARGYYEKVEQNTTFNLDKFEIPKDLNYAYIEKVS
jgi:hypothetical protein